MKKLVSIILALIPVIGLAQGTVNDLETDFGGRVNVSVNKKIMKGLHVVADGEIRLSDNFSSLGRYQAGMGTEQAACPGFLSAGRLLL